jgi:hypothetical protein
MLAAFFVGGGDGFEFVFDFILVRGGCWREAHDGGCLSLGNAWER